MEARAVQPKDVFRAGREIRQLWSAAEALACHSNVLQCPTKALQPSCWRSFPRPTEHHMSATEISGIDFAQVRQKELVTFNLVISGSLRS